MSMDIILRLLLIVCAVTVATIALRAHAQDMARSAWNYSRDERISLVDTPLAHIRWTPSSNTYPSFVNTSDANHYSTFAGNISGRSVQLPGQSGRWTSLGLGVTWHTPWSGRLSVGAKNIITYGKNPFSSSPEGNDEGAIPYVRYEQDL